MAKRRKLYDYDVLIIGGGITGLTMALAAAHYGLTPAIIDKNDFNRPSRDGRAYALSHASLNLFDHLGLTGLRELAEPMRDMRVEEAERGQAPSPFKLEFAAPDTASLAFMLEAKPLTAALHRRIKDTPDIDVIAPAHASALRIENGFAEITLQSGGQALRAPLVIAADGGASRLRQWAGIGVRREPYGQSVIVANVQFEKPHHGISRQIFYHGQPFALLPMTNNRAQIPWFDTHKAIKAASALSDEDFIRELSLRFHGEYGDISLLSPRYSYPVALQAADKYAAPRIALIGDAAHQISPLIGQGLNLGLRDVASLASLLHDARQTGQDLGGPILSEYDMWRGLDSRMLGAATDMLTKLYGIKRGPLAHLRRLGVGAVNKSIWLKKILALEASGTTGDIPPLLKPAQIK
jgi:2-octaprenyl-6-methoxyphenol hydroxylase